MTEATLSLGVRQINGTACILDIEGDITAFSEEALMDAYTEGSGDGVKTSCTTAIWAGWMHARPR